MKEEHIQDKRSKDEDEDECLEDGIYFIHNFWSISIHVLPSVPSLSSTIEQPQKYIASTLMLSYKAEESGSCSMETCKSALRFFIMIGDFTKVGK